ncbi:hypothetical protein BVI434_2710004 [Burkholderia vietnamiensis]|nr:hypothetical protein BVI434_2710004 [Burkholderia vietnamiensis]
MKCPGDSAFAYRQYDGKRLETVPDRFESQPLAAGLERRHRLFRESADIFSGTSPPEHRRAREIPDTPNRGRAWSPYELR